MEARADELLTGADALLQGQFLCDWKKAARLFGDAAELRADGDVAAIEEHTLAGILSHCAGALMTAQIHLQKAAEVALRSGRVVESAHLFVEAAFIAQERGDPKALRLFSSARHLAGSPHLTPRRIRRDPGALAGAPSPRAGSRARP
jgi:hypothetical protein